MNAIVFYATSDIHAVAVLTFVHLLRPLGIGPDVTLVMLHLRVSRYLLAMAGHMEIDAVRVDPLPYVRNWYYRDCLVKFRALQLYQYERVIYVDADAMPLRSLDHLFQHDKDRIGAVQAYWTNPPSFSSALFVATPSATLWDRVAERFPRGEYDAEVYNQALGDMLSPLPPATFCLNSEWEDARRPCAFGDHDSALSSAAVVHFTALGKPWSYAPHRVRALRPHAHPMFYDMWERWWTAREELFEDSSRLARLQHGLLKRLCQQVLLKKAMDVAWHAIR